MPSSQCLDFNFSHVGIVSSSVESVDWPHEIWSAAAMMIRYLFRRKRDAIRALPSDPSPGWQNTNGLALAEQSRLLGEGGEGAAWDTHYRTLRIQLQSQSPLYAQNDLVFLDSNINGNGVWESDLEISWVDPRVNLIPRFAGKERRGHTLIIPFGAIIP